MKRCHRADSDESDDLKDEGETPAVCTCYDGLSTELDVVRRNLKTGEYILGPESCKLDDTSRLRIDYKKPTDEEYTTLSANSVQSTCIADGGLAAGPDHMHQCVDLVQNVCEEFIPPACPCFHDETIMNALNAESLVLETNTVCDLNDSAPPSMYFTGPYFDHWYEVQFNPPVCFHDGFIRDISAREADACLEILSRHSNCDNM